MNGGDGDYQIEAEAEFEAKDENRGFTIGAIERLAGSTLLVQKI